MEEVKREVLETLHKMDEVLDSRSAKEIREDVRADRGDAILDRMDNICDKLTDKLTAMAITLTGVDTRLSNHLVHHEKFEKNFLYPIGIALVLGAGAIIWAVVRVHL
jgi:hypothetical protein